MKRLSKAARLSLLAAAAAIVVGAVFSLDLRQRAPAAPVSNVKSNVLLITVDTLRADALGSYGGDASASPALDRLAGAGVRFTTAYAHNVVTLPSHANILSGRLPFEHGVRDNWGGRFPPNVETLATLLKARGYRTGAFVSAFPLESRFGLDRGFDVYEDSFADAARPAFLEQERGGAETVRLAQQWIESGSGPYFCWVHVYEPHFPYAPPEPFASRFPGRQLYDGEVAATDAALAPLIDPIVSATSSIPTLIVFTSDHGESLGDHGEASHGIFAYDATLRVPLLVYHASLWRPRVVSSPVSHVDLLPTILDALGLRTPEDLPGRSLVPMIANEDSRERPIYFEALSGMLNRGWAPLRGVVSEGRKYIDLPIPELYDLSRDPREGRNLAESDRARATAMRDLLRRWPAAQAVSRQAEETGEVRERLRSLGYAGASAPARTNYTEEDDPKRLIHLDTLLQEVVTRYLEGDLRSAISTCRDLVARRPGMAVSHLYLAHLERAAGNLPAGIDALRNALALNPADAGTAALLGAYLTESGRAQEAIALLEPFVNREDSDVQVLTTAGLALARAGKNDEAIATLNRARDADPASAGVLVHIGTVHLIADRRAEAQQAFEQALALNPSLARAHSSLGLLAAERGDRASAVAHWQRAVASDPNEFTTVLQTGAALASRGRAEEARLFFEFFVSAAPPSRYASQIARAREWLARTSH